jgi:hypothetical protein
MTIKRWSKIFTLGDRHTQNIFKGPVQITEKIDGSQINFGRTKNGLEVLSKGAVVDLADPDSNFKPAVSHLLRIAGLLPLGYTFHGETLSKPKHNTMSYDRVPKGHIALYGVTTDEDKQVSDHETLKVWADNLLIDVVNCFFEGTVDTNNIGNSMAEWLETVSQLGKERIEGVVIKNYAQEFIIGGVVFPLTQAKYVSERFKERHKIDWKTTNKGPVERLGELVATEGRWHKAVQKLKDGGEWTGTPADIGPAIKSLQIDLIEEDKDYIKEEMWKLFYKEISRAAVKGFPEWYKGKLIEDTFSVEPHSNS